MSTAIVLNFDKAAKEYINYAQIQHVVAEKLSAYIPKSRLGNAIEYGAGSGIFTKHLSPWLGKVIATDASQAMCLEGKKNNPSIEWDRVDLRQPKEGPWDYIFSSSVLQWVDDPVNVFKVWKKSLAPEGRVIGSIFIKGTLQEWLRVTGGISPLTWKCHELWGAYLNEAGFKIIRQDTEHITTYYPNALECLKSLRGMGATPYNLINPARLRTWIKDYDASFKTTYGVTCTWAIYRFEAMSLD